MKGVKEQTVTNTFDLGAETVDAGVKSEYSYS